MAQPEFHYFISAPAVRVLPDSEDWHRPLRLARAPDARPPAARFSIGDYFDAARTFLERRGLAMIQPSLASPSGPAGEPAGEIDEIRIHLQKHGEFYHPARIEAAAGSRTASFVLNVAVSAAGLQCIDREYTLLQKLGTAFSPCFLPRVLGRGQVRGPGGRPVAMFLGQWFDGFYELHLARRQRSGALGLQVWDTVNGRFFLNPQQAARFYRRAACILTAYYNLKTFEQIGMWHHAAGDFVVCPAAGGLDVRLVTARRYAPLFRDPGRPAGDSRDAALLLQALLIFFLNLSLRMRLDRLEGVGDMAWGPELAVESTLTGFLEALALKPSICDLPDSPRRLMLDYLSACTRGDLLELGRSLAATFDARSEEAAVVRGHLRQHVHALQRAIAAATT